MNPLRPLGKPLARPVNNATGQIWPRQLNTEQATLSMDEELKKKQMAASVAQSRSPLSPIYQPR